VLKRYVEQAMDLRGSQIGLKGIISMQEQAGLAPKTCVKVDTPHFPERFQ